VSDRPDLGTRKAAVLHAVVEEYVRTGEPVGSETITERSEFGVSSATIRNEMAALEELGYLSHPHTSAGRIPTDAEENHAVELGDWGHAMLLQERERDAGRLHRGWVTVLDVRLDADHAGFPVGTRILVGYAEAATRTAQASRPNPHRPHAGPCPPVNARSPPPRA